MKFGSSDRNNNYENITFFPGPGHYDSRTAFNQPRTIAKGNRPIPKTAFGQTANRFDGQKDGIDLGPGYYFGQKEWQAKKLYKENKAQFYPNPRKIITIPSIPSSTHAMGYVEREDGYLIPLNGSTVKDENDLGPGVYDSNDAFVKKKIQGAAFNRMTSPRFPAEKSDEQKNRITLGNYTLPKPDVPEVEAEPKVKEPPKKVLSQEEEARRLLAKLDENPGLSPGYYHNEKLLSSFKVQTKAPEFQNFGTTSKRFVTTVTGKPNPGPGFYNVPLGQSATKTPYMKVEPYAKGEQRFKSAILDDLPGPGSYTANFDSNTEVNWTAQTGFPSAFGSGMTRFVAPKTAQDSQPGPGSYDPFKAKKNKKRKNKPAINSVVHAATPLSAVTPNFSRDLGYAPDLDLGGRSKGAVIVKHEEPINKGTSAFQSVGQRFEQNKDKRSMTPGPGSYDWKQKKLGVKPSHNTLKTTFALTPRGNESKGDTYKNTLGPGVYDYTLDIVKPKINYAPKINPIVPSYGALLPK